MLARIKRFVSLILFFTLINFWSWTGALAQDSAWRIGKTTGDVAVINAGVQQVSISNETTLKPGDYIRTGQNGRVLLVRGAESILITPNSVIHLPQKNKNGMSTTIIQQMGSALFEVEKQNVEHFEVLTPYLAAVVKGTQFQVTVNRNEARVDVVRGQVEVLDFKSGQHALVKQNQIAKVPTLGSPGLLLSGSGELSPILQSTPRSSPVDAMPEERLTTNSMPGLQQRQAAIPSNEDQSIFTWPASAPSADVSWRDDAPKDNEWSSRLAYRSSAKSSPISINDIASELTIPFAAGFFVFVTIGVKRRWQKRGQKTDEKRM